MLMIPSSGVAQISGKAFEGFLNQEAPIHIGSDTLKVFDDDKKLIYEGKVTVQQGTSTITTQQLVVHYTGQGQPQAIKSLEFTGDVVASSGDSVISADTGTYSVEKAQVVFAGNVIASQGENEAQGCELTLKLNTNIAELKACGDRVNTVINPNAE